MKTLKMWYDWIQKNKVIITNPEATMDELKAARSDLFKLSGAMHDNKPRKSRNQAFKLFVYNLLLDDLRQLWDLLPQDIQGINFYL